MPAYHTFLSHSSADKSAVEELARRLKQDNLEPWLDKWNLIHATRSSGEGHQQNPENMTWVRGYGC